MKAVKIGIVAYFILLGLTSLSITLYYGDSPSWHAGLLALGALMAGTTGRDKLLASDATLTFLYWIIAAVTSNSFVMDSTRYEFRYIAYGYYALNLLLSVLLIALAIFRSSINPKKHYREYRAD